MPNSKQKGKRGELEFVHALKALGIDARRTQQFCGTEGTADVDSEIDGLHWEVKRRTSIAAMRFIEQAERDRRSGDVPIVAMREDRGPWTLMIRLEHLQDLIKKFADHETSTITSDSSPSLPIDGPKHSSSSSGTKS